jgi:hypothetical protein
MVKKRPVVLGKSTPAELMVDLDFGSLEAGETRILFFVTFAILLFKPVQASRDLSLRASVFHKRSLRQKLNRMLQGSRIPIFALFAILI